MFSTESHWVELKWPSWHNTIFCRPLIKSLLILILPLKNYILTFSFKDKNRASAENVVQRHRYFKTFSFLELSYKVPQTKWLKQLKSIVPQLQRPELDIQMSGSRWRHQAKINSRCLSKLLVVPSLLATQPQSSRSILPAHLSASKKNFFS